MRTIRSRFKRDSLGWRISWRSHEITRRILDDARYRSPVVRTARNLADRAKPFGCIGGGTDCDGMRYAGASLHWTRADALLAVEAGYDGAEGPYGAEVVTGAEAREWMRDFEPDTRDRFAEAAGY